MKVLTVLMWHHLLVRQRRFIVTIFDLISPMLYFILLFCCRKWITGRTPTTNTGELNLNIHYTEPIRLINALPLSLVLYSPSTQLTDILMDAVGKQFGLSRLNTFPGPKSRGYYALDDLSSVDVTEFIKEMKDNSAIVLFSNMDGAEYPANLNYTIRMNVDFMTHIYKSLDDEIGPHQRFGTIYESFMRLQWAIDASYIKMRTNKNVEREIYLQEFPFVDSRENPQAAFVIIFVRMLSTYALLMPYIFLMQRLMQYRETGLEELIKMVGVTPTIFRLSHFINMLPCCLLFSVSACVLLKASSTPLLPDTNIVFIFIMLTLHFLTFVLIAFIFSHVSESSKYATSISISSFFAIYIINNLIINYIHNIPRVLRPVFGLLPLVPHSIFWENVSFFEQLGVGAIFKNLFHNPLDLFSNFVCFILMILQIILYSCLAWYVALVRPGKYGVALPCGFIFKRSYWIKKVSPSEELALAEESEQMVQDPRLFETVQHHTDVGIKIIDVTKVYGKKKVLSNVTLDVYKGEITVLLGHNGAGKTTLMSIITGMTSMTSGSVFVNGESLGTQPARVRRHLGLCPQHNLTVPFLTVHQQVIFFALLKGQKYEDAKSSSKKLLEQLGLESKLECLAEQLSGGMKRRLQLACALAGGSTVLILDEPTSGLDVETRRELWDLLQSLRGQHTVLLTTHFMEEADALGDRVAALHGGVLRCHATPMFLKKGIGTGYRLSLTIVGLPKEELITEAITSVVPQAVLKEKSYNSITYTLPSQDSDKFPALFSTLENQRSELNVESIGVGVSTLEDVFLKLCSDVDTQFTADSVDTAVPEPTHITKKGFTHYVVVMGLLMLRQYRYLAHNIFAFMFMQVIIPIGLLTMLTITTKMTHEEEKSMSTRQAMDLGLYRDMADKCVLYQGPALDGFRTLAHRYSDVDFKITKDDVTSTIINETSKKFSDYNKYLAGLELNDSSAKVLYTTAVRHAAPIALNMLSNLLAWTADPHLNITTYNYPLKHTTLSQPRQPLDKTALITWVVFLVCIYLGTLTSAISLALAERRLGTRHIHVMAGCPPALHWLATLAAHTLVYAVCLLTPLLLLTLIDDVQTINEPSFVGALCVILLASTTAWLAAAYLMHFLTTAVTTLLSLTMIIFGVAPAIVMASLDIAGYSEHKWWLSWPTNFLNLVSPAYASTAALAYAVSVASDNAFCSLNKQLCPKPLSENFLKCCEKGGNPNCYLCMEDGTPMKHIIILLWQTVVYMVLVILSEYGVFGKLWDRLINAGYVPPKPAFRDPMVIAEKTYVDKAIEMPKNQIPDAMLVSDVHKSYFRCRHPCSPFQAVKGVSFSVKKGECFGVLGVNGAGKSTTFKMITAEVEATRGRCFANSHHLKAYKIPYMQSLGYCPQFFGMDEFMTGRDNLKLLLTLRGMRSTDIDEQVNAWIAVAGLERYADVCVSAYSGGCARRLAAAGALAAGAAVTLLDEPTAGVDVAARRRVWLAVRKGLRNRRAVVLTSHSMDEMEALCDRIAIMAGGELAALGSAAALRAAHAQGHAVALKVHPSTPAHAHGQDPATDETDSAVADPLLPLKKAVEKKFTCRLTEEHKTMLHYHVEDSVRYSELFQALEELKRAFPGLIEDYSVSETTLEEAFLSFAQPSGARTAADSPA